jgi:hypothetical protein
MENADIVFSIAAPRGFKNILARFSPEGINAIWYYVLFVKSKMVW